MINILYLLPFLFIGVMNLFAEKKSNVLGRYLTKPLLMPSLLLFYVLCVEFIDYYIVMALVCAFLGDVFLLKPEKFLIPGLLFFMVCHVVYSSHFLNSIKIVDLPTYLYLLMVPYIIFIIWILSRLYTYLNDMKVPAIIYLGVILFMSFTTVTRYYVAPLESVILVFLGSVFFIISDSVLAFSLFKKKVNNDFIVMSTYILAQALLILGLIL